MKSMTMPLKAMGSDDKRSNDPIQTVGVPPNPSFKRTRLRRSA
jgi:hypothetical protein